MDYNTKLKNKMNEILRGDTDTLARKYIGRSAENWNRKDKENALAEKYEEFQREFAEAQKAKSDINARKEQIENEMKNIRGGDRDELLSQRIKNYDPSISNKEKDAILGKVYDELQKERARLNKVHSIEEYEEIRKRRKEISEGKTSQTELPKRLKPEVKPLPLAPKNPEIKTLPGRPGTAELMPLPYKPEEDNGYTNYRTISKGKDSEKKGRRKIF